MYQNFIIHVIYEFLKLLFDIFGCSIVVPSGSSVVFTICCIVITYRIVIKIIDRDVKSLLHITNN